ncbi:ornithine carbamoyltransferase [Rhizobiaceae bacterium]|nr:ornithine carbamoyltransferase [Rhizobiaceae bacterium]
MRHFLDLAAVPATELRAILDRAVEMKSATKAGTSPRPLEGKTLAMIFDKASTRTRVSFEVGMRQLGGHVVMLDGASQVGSGGETLADTARVLSRYVDAIMIRTGAHDGLLELAENATVPVINGLTDDTHPCQIMADVMTFEEHRGPIAGKRLAWLGDGNNVLHSFIEGAARFGYTMAAGVPTGREPLERFEKWARGEGATIEIGHDAVTAAKGSDALITDKWVSMGFEDTAAGDNTFGPFRVDDALMQKANSDAVFMHCLPAKRGEEVTADVIDGPQSIVFDEAENRLHAQKAILEWCLA